ncbi:hydrogenase expression/formation protein HypE [Hymenobacter roseosalivarius DSM 11622]|uniref:Hydrogenase expression/formation protein HypE n=1 Tax=Hymenobacter roseosalivarius DSM 11622 TaxID=645990 RepID=A0A1W1VMY3_9BACT|nr:hydrogenase expression/formation protein HypE [Hymenobacter roseosalivarius]SMB94729.1 hydrogenase expression/formation protein HypE [Hymenobacter roseosalivarius DSM 11622]
MPELDRKAAMQLQCPMPQLDFDIITLGHGSGGVLTHNLLNSGVFDILKNDYLDQHHDGAFLPVRSPVAFTTDSFVITPVFFPGGNIGELAVYGTVNDLAMCGATPRFLSLSFIIEEGLPMTEFWDILVSIKFACQQANVQVVTGDTKVVERGKGDRIFVNTTGIGEIHPKAHIAADNVRAGDKIIVSGQVATHGMAIMSVREGLVFETELESDTCNLYPAVEQLLEAFGADIHFLRDPTRGGVATVLNELAQDCGLGIDLVQNDIPLSEQVEGACEMLGLDPLYVANEGIFIAVVQADVAGQVLDVLRATGTGQNAAIIGAVTVSHPRQVILTSSIGGRRMLNMLTGEQLPRIC